MCMPMEMPLVRHSPVRQPVGWHVVRLCASEFLCDLCVLCGKTFIPLRSISHEVPRKLKRKTRRSVFPPRLRDLLWLRVLPSCFLLSLPYCTTTVPVMNE